MGKVSHKKVRVAKKGKPEGDGNAQGKEMLKEDANAKGKEMLKKMPMLREERLEMVVLLNG
jgi:hypothetical protein